MGERNPTTTDGRLLAALLRDVLARESFDTLADLTETLKRRCARLRIPWTNDAIGDAFRMVGSNRPLTAADQRAAQDVRRRRGRVVDHDPATLSKDEAHAALMRLLVRL